MLIPMDRDGRKKQQELIDKLGPEEILSYLSEECCELGQAANKMRRVLHGTTPVSMEEAEAMLEEEIGDVLLLIDCVERLGFVDMEAAKASAKRKNERWYGRTVGESL